MSRPGNPAPAGPSGRAAILLALLAPCFWGSTYIVFTQTLPVEHPLLVAALRALPAGILLMLLGAGLPPREKLGRLLVLGLANIGLFFALLFFSAARLPGGVAATLSSSQPLVVAFLAWPLLGRAPRAGQVLAALAGLAGVAMLVLDSRARLDLAGAAAALLATCCMAMGTVLIERWGRLGTPLQLAAWQLTLGGAVLLPFALLVEGAPPVPDARNLLGLAYLVLPGTALAYFLWVRGIAAAGARLSFFGLLSPVVATLLGATLLGEWLAPVQMLGIVLVLGSTLAGMLLSRR